MSQFDEVFGRISAATGCKTQVQLAEVLEIRQSSISDAKRRDSIPAEWYVKLFKKFGLNPDWLEDGTGPWRLKDRFGEYVTSDGPAPEAAMRAPTMPAYDKGVTVQVISATGEVVGRLCIPQAVHREGLTVLKVTSSSMEPEIRRGAFVGIDKQRKHIESGELYAVYENAVISLFRIFAIGEGFQMDRGERHPQMVPLSLPLATEKICGRIVWVLQEL
jgi:hypothetical protein